MNATCAECGGKCCKTIAYANNLVRDADVRELFDTRMAGRSGAFTWINSVCRHLRDGKCSIYEARPQFCVDFEVDGPECRATREALAE